LLEAMEALKTVDGINFVHFDETDVVRHQLVQRIVRAYEDYKTQQGATQLSLALEPKPKANGEAAGKTPGAGAHVVE
jgi:phosphate starvation-inducible PhoH-like protein